MPHDVALSGIFIVTNPVGYNNNDVKMFSLVGLSFTKVNGDEEFTMTDINVNCDEEDPEATSGWMMLSDAFILYTKDGVVDKRLVYVPEIWAAIMTEDKGYEVTKGWYLDREVNIQVGKKGSDPSVYVRVYMSLSHKVVYDILLGEMRKKRQFKAGRCYHLVSRIAHRAFFFDEEEKMRFVELLMRVEYFSSVKIISWCVMSNHIHVYIYLDEGHEVGEEELLSKINRLYRGARLEGVMQEWKTLKASSDGTIAGSCDFAAFKQSFVNRMFHPSEFMKTLKHHYTSSYNGRRNHSGTMWEGRFHHRESKRESKEMSAVAAYIDCNPCEGGICKWPTEYKWCGWTAAMEGDEHCRSMYRFIYGATVEDENDWSAIVKRHEDAIRKRIGEIEDDEKAGRFCDSIFGRPFRETSRDGEEGAAAHIIGVKPIDVPKKWTVQLERGSNAVAAKLLMLLGGGDRSAEEIAEELEIKSRPFLMSRYLVPLMEKGLIRQTIPDKPKSRFQRYALA